MQGASNLDLSDLAAELQRTRPGFPCSISLAQTNPSPAAVSRRRLPVACWAVPFTKEQLIDGGGLRRFGLDSIGDFHALCLRTPASPRGRAERRQRSVYFPEPPTARRHRTAWPCARRTLLTRDASSSRLPWVARSSWRPEMASYKFGRLPEPADVLSRIAISS
jgi:hypothetical protein